jgi:hypothetical protein
LRRGTLVVFTAGPDTARRASDVEVDGALQRTRSYRVLAVGLGWREVNRIGRDGGFEASSFDDLLDAFSRAAADVEGEYRGAYSLQYCSPARSGHRVVRIDVAAGGGEQRPLGSVETEYDATGFEPGCTPSTVPSFAASSGHDASRSRESTSSKPRAAGGSAPASKKPAAVDEPPDPSDGFVP